MVDSSSTSIRTHRWTRDQYEQIVEAGVLTEEDRVELLNGHILTMSPQNSRHATVVTLCRQALETACQGDCFVRTQAPLALGSHSEPEPDLALIAGNPQAYWKNHPTRAELIVEVAESSLEKDRSEKRPLYAQHDIPEYWIINLVDTHVEVYRSPTGDDYGSKQTLTRDETLAPSTLPCSSFPVSKLIPE